MGVYDSIRVMCPNCGRCMLEFQVRYSGYHREYSIYDVPADVATAFENDDDYAWCDLCGAEYELSTQPPIPKSVQMYLVERR